MALATTVKQNGKYRVYKYFSEEMVSLTLKLSFYDSG